MKGRKDPNLVEFARRLKGLLAKYKSYREAAEDLDIPESTLARVARGANEPGSALLLALSTKLNISMSYLLGLDDEPAPAVRTGERSKPDVSLVHIRSLDARAAAGAGEINHIVAIEKSLPFPVWMLHKLASPGAKVSFMRASGDSMSPTFENSALLLVNESENELQPKTAKLKSDRDNADIFVFLQGADQRVKRLRRLASGEILILSDNAAYEPEILRGPEIKRLKIVGRVIWWDNRL